MGGRSRGQILVLASLLIAVLFVGLAVVLNGAIYSENLSVRDTGSTADPVVEAQVTEDRLREAAQHANWNDDDVDFDTREQRVLDSMGNWDGFTSADAAQRGLVVDVAVADTTEGVRVSQEDPSDFMPANEDLDQYLLDTTIDPLGLDDRTNWMVAKDVQTRAFQAEVRRTDLYAVDQSALQDITTLVDSLLDGSSTFWMEIDEGETTWRVYLVQVQETADVAVVVTSDDGSETVEGTCQATGDWVDIDFETQELQGDDTVACNALGFHDNLDRHDIYWVGADEVHGTYHFIGDKPEDVFRSEIEAEYAGLIDSLDCLLVLVCLPDLLDDFGVNDLLGQGGNPHPFTTSAVYDVTLSFEYNNGDVEYERQVTVA